MDEITKETLITFEESEHPRDHSGRDKPGVLGADVEVLLVHEWFQVRLAQCADLTLERVDHARREVRA